MSFMIVLHCIYWGRVFHSNSDVTDLVSLACPRGLLSPAPKHCIIGKFPCLSLGFGDPNSSSHACVDSTSSTESSP